MNYRERVNYLEKKSCRTCDHDSGYFSALCKGCVRCSNYEPKQVYISTADNQKILNAVEQTVLERIILNNMDVNSLYPTVQCEPIKIDLKEIEHLMEMKTQWSIHRPLNPLYGIAIGKPCKEKEKEMREPKKVIFNDPATIVFWHDGTKTVVKAIDEPFDPEKGLAMAIAKKYLGNEGNYYNTFKKWLPKEEEITIPTELEKLVDAMKKITTGTRGMK